MEEQVKEATSHLVLYGVMCDRFGDIKPVYELEVVCDLQGRESTVLGSTSDHTLHTHRVAAGDVLTLLGRSDKIDGSEEAVKIVMTAEGHVGWLWHYECEPV